MDCSFYLQSFSLKPDALKQYGFVNSLSQWTYEKNLKEKDLFVQISINSEKFIVRVIDRNFDDDFLPFSVKDGNSPVKNEVDEILQDILNKCFSNPCLDVVKYCENKYLMTHEEPWDDLPGYYTFKTKQNQKWYAIIMHLPAKRIGLTGDMLVDIINVKLPSDVIESLIDNKHYFTSYHMNKKHWLTILLDNSTDMAKLHELIDISYSLVEKPKCISRFWLVPSNVQCYDIETALSNSDELTWQPRVKPNVDDIIFIYESKPIAAVKYKFIVTKSENYAGAKLVTIKLLKHYDGENASLQFLKKNGVGLLRWPIHITEHLAKLIDEVNS